MLKKCHSACVPSDDDDGEEGQYSGLSVCVQEVSEIGVPELSVCSRPACCNRMDCTAELCVCVLVY